MTRRLTNRQRHELYLSESQRTKENSRGEFPICRLCDLPILPGQKWDRSHEKLKPRWLGGEIDGIAHTRCNRRHNNTHDTPLFAKNECVRKRHLDLTRSRTPLPGGRDDRLKRKISGEVVVR